MVADRQKRCLSDDGHFGDEPSRCRWLQARARSRKHTLRTGVGFTAKALCTVRGLEVLCPSCRVWRTHAGPGPESVPEGS